VRETYFLDTDPVRVFAIACRYQLEAEARLAAVTTVFKPLRKWPYGQDMDLITGWQMYRLALYHEKGVAAITKLFEDFNWIKQTHFCWFNYCATCDQGPVKIAGDMRRVCIW
jgi:hypothetical protein